MFLKGRVAVLSAMFATEVPLFETFAVTCDLLESLHFNAFEHRVLGIVLLFLQHEMYIVTSMLIKSMRVLTFIREVGL